METRHSHLIELLGSDEPQVIIVDRTYDFIGTEGTTKGTICKSWGSFEDGCQAIIDTSSGCGRSESHSYEWDKAGVTGIYGLLNKDDHLGREQGRSSRQRVEDGGCFHIIVQNTMITNLNPKLVWGGDAFVLSGTSRIWVDHVTVYQGLGIDLPAQAQLLLDPIYRPCALLLWL